MQLVDDRLGPRPARASRRRASRRRADRPRGSARARRPGSSATPDRARAGRRRAEGVGRAAPAPSRLELEPAVLERPHRQLRLRPRSARSTRRHAGAHSRNRALPSGRSSAPNGISWRRLIAAGAGAAAARPTGRRAGTASPGEWWAGQRTPPRRRYPAPRATPRRSSAGSVNGIASWCAFNSTRKSSSASGRPRSSVSVRPAPARYTPRQRAKCWSHSSSVISMPSGLSQTMSLTPAAAQRPPLEEVAAAEHRVRAPQARSAAA